MVNELKDLLDIALDREIVSEAFYIASQKKTRDPGAVELMRSLAREEASHSQWIKKLKEKSPEGKDWHPEKLTDLMISEYLVDIHLAEEAGLQDVITAAMKREQYSFEFYARMEQAARSEAAKRLCRKLVKAEREHKIKLEILYDDLFYKEN
jgi:rubrerythrin